MTLAAHVRTLGRGPGRSRSLTLDEAQEAMALMLSPDAAPQAVGALLMLLRMKGETAEEIAGFARAAAQSLPALPQGDLDWPSYASGRTRGLPWFLLSARLVAQAGYRVVLHGWNGGDPKVRQGVGVLGIPVCRDAAQADRALAAQRLAYLPLETLSPALFGLLTLRDVLGLRSCINTVCRMLNPTGAAASVQGVFHPSYRLVQADAARLLAWRAQSVITGGGGEFERLPGKDVAVFGLRDGELCDHALPALTGDSRRLDDANHDPARLTALWSGDAEDPFARAVVLGTAALALETLGVTDAAEMAERLWQGRHDALAA